MDLDLDLEDEKESSKTLKLPEGMPEPEKAPVYVPDVMLLVSFFEDFGTVLGLPSSVTARPGEDFLQDLLENVAHPAYDLMLGSLYVSLLQSSMKAAQEQGIAHPEVWEDISTLNLFSWPETLRRWVTFGPYTEAYRYAKPELVRGIAKFSKGSAGMEVSPEVELKHESRPNPNPNIDPNPDPDL